MNRATTDCPQRSLSFGLAASGPQSLWIINAYLVIMAGLLLGASTLGERIGHRMLPLIGLVIFRLASLGAAFSPTAGLLIAARAALTVGAASMMPVALALIRLSFNDERERNLAIAIWGCSYIFANFAGGLAEGD